MDSNQLLEPETQQYIEEPYKPFVQLVYASQMHPMTNLETPDFLDQDKDSAIDITCKILYSAIPMMYSFILNGLSLIVNAIFIGSKYGRQMFCGIWLGGILGNIFIIYVIEYVGVGFSILCLQNFDKGQQIGYLYQKTLILGFLICIAMTIVLYLSQYILSFFTIDLIIIQYASEYAWALLPSYYLFSFMETNKNYLQSQQVIFLPLLICSACVGFHAVLCYIEVYVLEFGFIGAAWAKNISDAICCLSLYFYIIFKEPTQDSWIEWSLKSTKNIPFYLKKVLNYQKFAYLEIIIFQILSLAVASLSEAEISLHFFFSIVYMLFYYCFNSMSQCLNKSVSLSIEENDVGVCKKKIFVGLVINLVVSSMAAINVIQHREVYWEILMSKEEINHFKVYEVTIIVAMVIGVESFNIVISGLAKTLEAGSFRFHIFLFAFIGLGLSSFLCYYEGYGLKGIWQGWLISTTLSCLVSIYKLASTRLNEKFEQIRQNYRSKQVYIRQSRMQISKQ